MIEGKKREQKRLLKQIDRETCLARIKAVLKDSGYKFHIEEYEKKAMLDIWVSETRSLCFFFLYEGAAEKNQTEHLLNDIKTILEINSRYANDPFLSRGDNSLCEWSE